MPVEQLMLGIEELKAKMAQGGYYFVAAAEELLKQLPKGNWIGGTIPLFMTEQGGIQARDKAYALKLPTYITRAEIRVYDEKSLANIYKDAPGNGFSLIIIPASSKTHLSFALNAPGYEEFASSPLAGWISGVPLPNIDRAVPKVFDGRTSQALDNAAVVMHLTLPKGKTAVVGIINIFEPSDGDILTFPGDGFKTSDVLVNGQKRNFAQYIAEKELDTKLPLVADYGGAMINVSFNEVAAPGGEVSFFAPVFRNTKYRHAKPVGEYLRAFMDQKPGGIDDRILFSCNCMLNYIHSGLEGKRTIGFTGPVTFGEIAYQLLNQTAVYVEIATANLAERLRTETTLRRQHRLLGTLMDTIPDPVYYKDMDGKIVGCNKAYETFTALPKAEILGKAVREIFPKEIADIFEEKNHELILAPGSQTYELTIPDRTGTIRHTVIHAGTYPAAGGGVGGIVSVIRDVTELRRASDELRLFRDLIDSSTDSVMIIVPADGRLMDVNQSACEALGYSKPELLKMRFVDVSAGMPAGYDWQNEVARIKGRASLLLNWTHKQKNGDTFPAEVNIKYVVLEGVEYLVAIMRDITERKKMEAAMKELHTLEGLIPICANCKKVRNDKGYWERVETYISQRSEAKFSHGLCEECINKLYGKEEWFKSGDK